VVRDINANPRLPFENDTFDTVLVTVSVQYMPHPLEVFADVRRILRYDRSFYVIYSNRMFYTKAIAIWQRLIGIERNRLISSYFVNAGGWSNPKH